MYKLHIANKAKKELEKISLSHKLAILSVLEEIREDPFAGKPLARELTGRFTFRVGVYRIIYKVNEKDKIVEILTAGHRSAIYN